MRSPPIWWMLVTASIYGNVFSALFNKPELASTSEHLLTSLPDGSEPVSVYASAEETSSRVPHQNPLAESDPDINGINDKTSPSHGTHALSHLEPYTLLPIYQVGRPVLQLTSHPEPETLLPIYQLGPAPVLNPDTPDVISATSHPASYFGMLPSHLIPWNHVSGSPMTKDGSRHLHLEPQPKFPHLDSFYHIPDVPSTFISPYHHPSPYPHISPYLHISPYPRISPYPHISLYQHSPYPHILDHPGTSSGAVQPMYPLSAPHMSPLDHSIPRVENTDTDIFQESPFTSFLSHRPLNPDAPSFYPPSYSATQITKGTGFFPTELRRFDDDFRMRSEKKDVPRNPAPESSITLTDPKPRAPPTSNQRRKMKKNLRRLTKLLESKPSDSSSLWRAEVQPVQGSKRKTSWEKSSLDWAKEREKSLLFSRSGSRETELSPAKELIIGQHRVNIDSPLSNTPTTSWHLAPAHSQGLEEPTTGPHVDQVLQHSIYGKVYPHGEDSELEREPKDAQASSLKLQGRPSALELAPVSDVKTANLFQAPEDDKGSKLHYSPAGRQGPQEPTMVPHEDQLSQHLVSSGAPSHGENIELQREPEATQAASSKLQDQLFVKDKPVLDMKDPMLFAAVKDTMESDNRATPSLSLHKHLRPSVANSNRRKFPGESSSSSNFVADARDAEKLKDLAKSSTLTGPNGRKLSQRPKKVKSVRSVIMTNEDRRADMEPTSNPLRAQLERSTKLKDSRGKSSMADTPLPLSIKTFLDSSSSPRRHGLESPLESDVIVQENFDYSASKSADDRLPQRRVNIAPMLSIPDDGLNIQKKPSKTLTEDLDFADPKLLNKNIKIAPKSGPSKTRAKEKSVKIDIEASSTAEPPQVGHNFWSKVAPMISHLRVKTSFGYLPFLSSSTSRFLEFLKALNPRKWMGKYEPDDKNVYMGTDEIKYIDELQEVHGSKGAMGDGESSSSHLTSKRVQTHPARRKRKKNLSTPATAKSADINAIDDLKEILDDPALDAITRSLQVDDDRDFLRLDIQPKDYETIRTRDNTDWEAIRTFIQIRSKASEKELERRIQVLLHQLQHYDISVRYAKVKPRLDEVTINRWKHLFGIEELCPTLSHIHKADGVEVQSVKTLSKLEKEVLTEVLGESELTKRIDLINYMRQKDLVSRWWSEEQLQDARWQGLRVLDLLSVGDLLRFGLSREDGFPRPHITLFQIYEKMITRRTYPEIYPIQARSWGESPEREWFHQHPTLWYEYQARMRTLILECNFPILGDSSLLRELGRPPVSPWWSLGDFLMWNDEGVRLGTMAEVADRVGKQLDLTQFKRLNPGDLEMINWKSALRGIDSDTRHKAKICLEKRARWNGQLKGPNISIFSYLRNKFMGKPLWD